MFTLLSDDEVDPCEKLVTRLTILATLKYHESVTDSSVEESTKLEANTLSAAQPAPDLLPGEHSDIRIDVNELLANADEWLAAPNSNFGGRRPSELIGTADEPLLRETLRSTIYSGMA
jgi:hypothetical protein